jgi:ABC-type Fe2+-enterobactin transport system substrate-binding protein
LEFLGAVYFADELQLNSYQVNLSLVTNTKNSLKINVAMERLKAFVYSELANAVYIHQDQTDVAEMLQMIGSNMVTLPEEPVDQIVGMMLYSKLNAIMEGVMTVVSLDISSSLGDDVWYQHDDEDSMGSFAADGWWHLPTVQHDSLSVAGADTKVVEVRPNAWIDYGLMWPDETNNKDHSVVYANFPKK